MIISTTPRRCPSPSTVTLVLLSLGLVTAAGCSSTTETRGGQGGPAACTTDAQCVVGKEVCDPKSSVCSPIPQGVEIGKGDGSPTSVTLTEIYTAPSKRADLVDLSFSQADPTQLWAIGYADNSVHVGSGIAADSVGTWKSFVDPAARHFMHKPPAIAWGSNGFWGICGDNDNSQNDPGKEPNFFMGPALFTSDLAIFAKATPEGLGSHYDMLHNTTFCRGITHVDANWFWVFNGELGSLDKYNFGNDHGPGADDHSDGEIYRYANGQLKGVAGIPSHLAYDATDQFLYVADTGNKRIVRLNTATGAEGGELPRRNEPLKKNAVVKGAELEEVVPAGILEQPSGLKLKNGLVYVTDAATSSFYVFDKTTGAQVRTLESGLPARSLAGFTFGPDGKIWFVDRVRSKVLRIDPL